jgi:putative FmdB family regulatory protein
MPIYDFVCRSCRARTEVFTRTVAAPVNAICSNCGQTDLARAISKFAFVRSESEVFGDMGKLLDVDVDENDPEAMAHWARRMKDTLGDDADPQLDELIREGEDPYGLAGLEQAATAGGDTGLDMSEGE